MFLPVFFVVFPSLSHLTMSDTYCVFFLFVCASSDSTVLVYRPDAAPFRLSTCKQVFRRPAMQFYSKQFAGGGVERSPRYLSGGQKFIPCWHDFQACMFARGAKYITTLYSVACRGPHVECHGMRPMNALQTEN
jgi:hypothetical protein